MHIIYEAVIGSKLKGNDTAESDTDTMGIFIAKNEDIGGFDWNDSKNTVTNASPDGDDETFYELRKFFRLAAKSTPAILPFLASDKLISSSPLGEEAIRIAREDLVSIEWLRKNANYSRGKFIKYFSGHNPKDLIEAFYIGELSCRWLFYGRAPSAALVNPELHYWSYYTFDEFIDLPIGHQEDLIETLARMCEQTTSETMPIAEPDWTRATEFLKHVRNNIG